MARRKIPGFAVLWARHEACYIDVFSQALQRLQEKEKITGDEDNISEILYYLLNEVSFRISKTQNKEVQCPVAETPKRPVVHGELKGKLKKQKRPDFTCFLRNHFAELPEEYEIPLHIECKRLGKVTSPQWDLNKKYVEHGIQRFDNISHQYGKRAAGGMMIGYIIGMTPEKIEESVNCYQKIMIPGNTALQFTFNTQKDIYKTIQHLKRVYVAPKEFKLYHLWINLIHNYSLE